MRDFKSFSVSIDHGRLFGEIEFSGDSRIYGYTTSGKWVHFEPRSKSTIGISEFIDEHWNSRTPALATMAIMYLLLIAIIA